MGDHQPYPSTATPETPETPELVLTRDLRAKGLDGSEIRSVTAGLHRVRRGVFTTYEVSDRQARHLLATRATLRMRQQVVASHTSAAVAHGLWVPPELLDAVHVTATAPHVKDSTRNGVHLHAGPIPPHDVVSIDEVVATRIPRTVADCAMMLPFVDAVIVADQALQQPDVTPQDLELALAARGRRRGVARARRVLRASDWGAESPGETRIRLILVDAGFDVESQVVICRRDGTFVARVDLKLRDHPVFVEFDGRAKYQMGASMEAVLWAEKLRFDKVHELGLEGFRVIWNHLARPRSVVERTHQAIARAEKRGLGDTLFIEG